MVRTRLIKLRFRRRLRKSTQKAGSFGVQAEQHIDRHLLRRFDRLAPVRRFVFGWVGLMLLLIGMMVAQNVTLGNSYQTLRPAPGGIYNEGVLGRFTTANPLFAVSDADSSVSRLIFAGLFTYDEKGKLTGDLAKNYTTDEHGITYTVRLKPNLTWQDGRPLTSEDVVFTYRLIQNPDVRSPLQSAWQGIEVSAPDRQTVVFKLPGALAAFPYSLTTGIVPEHLLKDVSPPDLRSADFNTVKPIGAGPFKWDALRVKGDGNPQHLQVEISLVPFTGYQAGEPKLQRFFVKTYADKAQLIDAFKDNQLTGVEGLTEVPVELKGSDKVQVHNLPIRAATMVFFKTTTSVLADQTVRQSLVNGANVPEVISSLDYPARQLRAPIFPGQPGYDPSLVQPGYDLAAAKDKLDKAGWVTGKDGIRNKDKQKLSFILTTADTPEYHTVTKQLQQQWRKLGVRLDIRFLNSSDFQNALNYHDYDAILYGIAIGPDPDVFVYWDSSQSDIRSANRLNLSEYKNSSADAALESGRTRIDPQLRTIKYKPFLQAWQAEAPALALYQPRALYLTNGPLAGLGDAPINIATNRLDNVHNWMISYAKVTN